MRAMPKELNMRALSFLAAATLVGVSWSLPAQAVDDKAADKLIRDNKCGNCHTVARDKEGPAFRKTAEKYKGQADAEQKLMAHLTSEPIVKVDGKEEKHKRVEAANEAEIKNLAQWILSR
jgi:cytochrome c